jgi:hypothetical protein
VIIATNIQKESSGGGGAEEAYPARPDMVFMAIA